MIVPVDNAGEFISGTAPFVGVAVGATVAVSFCTGAVVVVSVLALTSSFFFLPVTIKIIRAINNNKTPPVINNPGIDKNQSKLKFIQYRLPLLLF